MLALIFIKNEKKWENTQARSRSWISYHLSTNRLAGQNASQAIPMTWSLRFISPYAGHLFQCCARPLQKTAKTVHLLLFTPSDACNINACTEMPWMRYNRNSTLTDDRCFTTKLLPKIRKLSLASSTGSMEHCPTCTVNAIHAFSASYKHSAMTDWTKWMTRKEEEKRAARTQTRVKTLDHQYLTICRLIVSTVAADTARNHASAETLTVMNTFINAFVCFRRCEPIST